MAGMRFRKLRIAFSAACLIACLLLLALWVRSYWWWDWYNSGTVARQNATIGSSQGWLGILIRIGIPSDFPHRPYSLDAIPVGELPVVNGHSELRAFHYPWGRWEYSITIPHWFLVFSTAIFASTPWIPWRFSLRTLLIATTLIALVLGLAVFTGEISCPL
jgi:hypothetical protein